MTSTSTLPPVMESEQIYNMIMEQIEPELTTEVLPFLDEIFSDESLEDREARGQWYAIAFGLFEEQYGKFIEGWKSYYMELKRKAEALGQKIQEHSEEGYESTIEESIQKS